MLQPRSPHNRVARFVNREVSAEQRIDPPQQVLRIAVRTCGLRRRLGRRRADCERWGL